MLAQTDKLLGIILLVAITVHVEKGFFAQGGGYEYPLIIVLVLANIASAIPALTRWAVCSVSRASARVRASCASPRR